MRIEDVTNAADLGKGAFYNYFDSKDDLFAVLLSEAIDLLDSTYLREAHQATRYDRRVAAICRGHDLFFVAHPVYLLLIHQARGSLLREADNQPELVATFRRYLSRVAALLQGSEPPSDDAMDLASALVGSITGYYSFRISAGLAPTSGTVEQLLLHGLKEPVKPG